MQDLMRTLVCRRILLCCCYQSHHCWRDIQDLCLGRRVVGHCCIHLVHLVVLASSRKQTLGAPVDLLGEAHG